MALWQLDAFEYRLTNGQVVTVYQLLDDAFRFDVGSWAYCRHGNSADTQDLLDRAIHHAKWSTHHRRTCWVGA